MPYGNLLVGSKKLMTVTEEVDDGAIGDVEYVLQAEELVAEIQRQLAIIKADYHHDFGPQSLLSYPRCRTVLEFMAQNLPPPSAKVNYTDEIPASYIFTFAAAEAELQAFNYDELADFAGCNVDPDETLFDRAPAAHHLFNEIYNGGKSELPNFIEDK